MCQIPRPFDYFESRAFLPRLDAQSAACLYGMTGGVPLYLMQFDDSLGLAENVESAFLDPSSILYEEPANLLKREVSKAAPYNAVISAIAGGATQHNEIAARAGLESGALDYFLKELARIGLVRREAPIAGRGGRKAIWVLQDNLFRFWYRFVRPRQSLVDRGLGASVTPRIMDGLSGYMGPVFEGICREWLWRELAAGRLGFEVTGMGRWWGNGPDAREEAEIDVVAVDDGAAVLVGECKWQAGPVGADRLAELDARAHLAGADGRAARWLFSRSGFTPGCREAAAAMPESRLVAFADMTS